jgi:hypothetical protein
LSIRLTSFFFGVEISEAMSLTVFDNLGTPTGASFDGTFNAASVGSVSWSVGGILRFRRGSKIAPAIVVLDPIGMINDRRNRARHKQERNAMRSKLSISDINEDVTVFPCEPDFVASWPVKFSCFWIVDDTCASEIKRSFDRLKMTQIRSPQMPPLSTPLSLLLALAWQASIRLRTATALAHNFDAAIFAGERHG